MKMMKKIVNTGVKDQLQNQALFICCDSVHALQPKSQLIDENILHFRK